MLYRDMLGLVSESRSRYYTKEDYQRLMALAKKDLKDYTWEDVRELRRIAEKMEKEARATEDREYADRLIESAVNVRVFAAVMEGLLLRRQREAAAPQGRSAEVLAALSTYGIRPDMTVQEALELLEKKAPKLVELLRLAVGS